MTGSARTVRAGIALALVLTAAGAGAAERPVRADAARPCPRYGPGFVQVPGSTTCLRVAGRVTAEAGNAPRRISRDQIAGFRTTGQVSADARTETEYGPVRSFVRTRVRSGTLRD